MKWWLSLVAAILAAPVSAQEACPPDQPQVAVLGVHHFVSQQNLLTQAEDDELAPQRQAELERIAVALAAFAPTKIAVERPYDQRELDRRYTAYVAGEYQATAEETDQIGFRLARMLGHERLYHVQYRGEFPLDALIAYARRAGRQAEYDAAIAEAAELTEAIDMHLSTGGLPATLHWLNTREGMLANHRTYMALNALADTRDPLGGERAGPELVAQWYRTNLNIYANIQALAEPGERLLVIYGQGHAWLLNSFAAEDAAICRVDILDYLPPVP